MPRYKRYGYTISVVNAYAARQQGAAFMEPSVVAFELNEKKALELVDQYISGLGDRAEIVADTSYDYVDQTPGDTLRTVLIEYPGGRLRSKLILQRWFVWVGRE